MAVAYADFFSAILMGSELMVSFSTIRRTRFAPPSVSCSPTRSSELTYGEDYRNLPAATGKMQGPSADDALRGG